MAKLIDITGKAISGEWGNDDTAGTGIPVLRTTNFTNDGVINYNNVVTRDIQKKDLSQKFLQPGDIILEKSGGSDKQPVGRVVYYDREPNKFLFNNFTGVLRVRDKAVWYPRYVFYALYGNYAKGGTRRYENKTTGLHNLKTDQYVQDFAIQEQPMEYQQQVVSKLDKVTELIALRKEQLVKLDQLVKSRFIELFGDPICNPKDWKTDKTENHIDLLSGFPFDSSQYTENGINICGGLIIMPQRIEWKDCKHWGSVEGYEEYTLKENDIVIALDRPWISEGFKIAMVDAEHLPALLIQRTARIRAIGINQLYLMYCFLLGGFDKHCNVTGSLVPHISAKDIRSFAIMLPPLELQEQFAAFVDQTDKSKLAIQQSLDKLELLKKSLMQEYFG